jgi:hypothetical protein
MISRRLDWPCILCMAVCLSAFVSPRTVTSATYYVSTSGSDGNAGSLSQPFGTIKHGTSVLRAGDTLRIRGGTYREYVSLDHAPRGSS